MAQNAASSSDAIVARRQPLFDSIAGQLKQSEFSDFVVECQGEIWHVHKVIVCSQSDYFKKVCTGHFKEEFEGVIDLPDDNACLVGEMLRYVYTADYEGDSSRHALALKQHDDHGPAGACCFTPLLFDVHMHTIGDKYSIPGLMQLANVKLSERLKQGRWSVNDFASAIEEMYAAASNSKKAMQDTTVKAALRIAEMLYNADVAAEYRQVASTLPEFASKLAAMLVNERRARTTKPTDQALAATEPDQTHIIVRNLPNGMMPINVYQHNTVYDIKRIIEQSVGVPARLQCILFREKMGMGRLGDYLTVAQCGLQEGSFIEVFLEPTW